MFKLFKKDLILFLHDHRSVILTFLLPVLLITLFAFAYGSIGAYDGRSEPVKLLVCDLDGTKSSKEIIHELDSLEDIITTVSDPIISKELVIKGEYAGALIIYKGFQDSVENGNSTPVELVYDRSREMEIGILQHNLISTLMSSTGEIIVKKSIEKYLQGLFPAINPAITDNIVKTTMKEDNKLSITYTSVVGEKNDTKLGLIQAVAGTAIMMLLFSVAAVGTSILEEKENGTINRLLYSPLKGSTILYSKMLFAFFISILQLTVMFLFAWIILKMDMSVSIAGLIMLIVATSFAVSSLGIFLASVAKTRQQAHNLSTIIILVMSAIGGSMIPLFIMPPILQKMALLSVNYWGIQGFYDLFWRALPLEEILPKILVLICIGVLMTSASIQLFKKRIIKS
ncbi:MAG: ABC transporter permease [Bacteroidales bacterium]|jgi:ABC-type Na+ efflux pump permease subunit|nr:ABC transporter permease [Bacteroidales bacterium]